MNSTVKTSVRKVIGGTSSVNEDILATEEPLEIGISYFDNGKRITKNLSITMRTPGNDEDLSTGFLFTEGIIENKDQVISIEINGENSCTVILKDDVIFDLAKVERHFYTSSSCGVCGKSSIDSVTTSKRTKNNSSKIIFRQNDIYELPGKLRSSQEVFGQTGGLHASALFNSNSEIILAREDVGRHNALDKLIGASLQSGMIPLSDYLLLLSGRASFELLQKAYMADIKIVVAVGAPSSLAVEFAKEKEITLIGFLRGDRFNVYCGEVGEL